MDLKETIREANRKYILENKNHNISDINNHGNWKINHFGLAKYIENFVNPGVGSLIYEDHEQMSNSYDYRSDISPSSRDISFKDI